MTINLGVLMIVREEWSILSDSSVFKEIDFKPKLDTT